MAKKETKKETKVGVIIKRNPESLEGVIVRPRVTEKATDLTGGNAYTFDVAVWANKFLIKKAVEKLYKVKPVRIAVVAVPGKNIIVRGRKGFKTGGKKAIVYLKKGDTIKII